MENIINTATLNEKRIKSKQQELDKIKQEIDRIDNVFLFDMTFDKYAKKSLMKEYHYEQSLKLDEYTNSVRLNRLTGNLVKRLTGYFRQQADNCPNVQSRFKSFEKSPNDKELKDAYNESFNRKIDELHNKSLELLADYFEIVGERKKHILKTELINGLPAPITVVDVETNLESKNRGISFDYATRKTTR